MVVAAGEKIGSYEVLAMLGRGGMGEVWRARDVRLDREVAIKILPEELARDKERVLRFDREARLLASLNHGNIAMIYGFEEADDKKYLVLEFVEGDTLAARLKRGALPIEEALDVCRQIAVALDAAHEKGVIHRDLKPGNVMLRSDGEVKVLDFGLARAMQEYGSDSDVSADSPTITADFTRPGVVLGTAAYMSPEQARGKRLDKRTDVWSFGCVLYECLTGIRPFSGESTSDTIAKILERDPTYDALPTTTPPRVRHILSRCLEKDARRRLRDVGDVAVELDEAVRSREWSTTAVQIATRKPKLRPLITPSRLLAAIVLLAIGAFAAIEFRDRMFPIERPTVLRTSITLPHEQRVQQVKLSPDGQVIAWIAQPRDRDSQAIAQRKLYVRRIDSYEYAPLPGTEGVREFKFTPDGKWISFRSPVARGSTLYRLLKIPTDGVSPPLSLFDWNPKWDEWGFLPNGDILIIGRDGRTFSIAPPDGGSPIAEKTIQSSDDIGGISTIHNALSDELTLVGNYSWHAGGFRMGVAQLNVNSGAAGSLLELGGNSLILPTGHLVFSRGEVLLAAPFDKQSVRLTSGPVPVLSGIRTVSSYDHGRFEVSNNGTLLYAPGGRIGANRQLVTIDPNGNVEPWSSELRTFDDNPSISPDGKWVAVVISDYTGKYEIWIADSATRRMRQFVAVKDADCEKPVWSPDSTKLAYQQYGRNDFDGIYVVDLDRPSLPVRSLGWGDYSWLVPQCWTPDGKELLIARARDGESDVVRVPTSGGDSAGDVEPEPLIGIPAIDWDTRYSPDGKWLMYGSGDSGSYEVHVCNVGEDVACRGIPISTQGGGSIEWSEDGRTAYYINAGRVMAVDISTEPKFSVSQPRELFDLPALEITGYIDMLDDGSVLAIQKGSDEQETSHVNIVVNWFEELNQKVPVNN